METTQQLKPLSPLEWGTLIDDHLHGGARRRRWSTAGYSSLPLFTLSLSSLSRKDNPFSLKLNILIFLEHHLSLSPSPSPPLSLLLPTLTSLLHDPIFDQFLTTTTSLFITLENSQDPNYQTALEELINLLLNLINRPNHGPDRQTRAVSCACLSELERAQPCLLSGIVGPLWALCKAERTHATQNYTLLLALIVKNIVVLRPNNILAINTNTPIVPFNLPDFSFGDEVSAVGSKDLRKVVSFLFEGTSLLTGFGTMEFIDLIIPVVSAMGLQPSLLKVQFSGMMYVTDPIMFHAYLMLYRRLPEAFRGEEVVVRRLGEISRETQSHLVFRVLAVHWLLGLRREKGGGERERGLFYPGVFDPLALKAVKIDVLAYGSVWEERESMVGRLFEDGMVSVAAFKWLPWWSTETAVAFRAFYKFLIGNSSHAHSDPVSTRALMQSSIFKNIQKLIVELTLEYKGLVAVHVSFIDRFLCCDKHRWLGECLLQTFDELLLPKLKKEFHRLPFYFPIFERISENDTIPPGNLIDLLTHFVTYLVKIHGPDTGLRTWSRGSKVLGICRIMLMHHHSSRLFLGLSRLLSFTCLYFPDLEVRDDARIYLRMLICIPGKKLRKILLSGEQLPGLTPAPQSSSYFDIQSQPLPDIKKSNKISSYIHILRVTPLLVKQSWSLSLPTLDSVKEIEPIIEEPEDLEEPEHNNNNLQIDLAKNRIEYPPEPLRVMDSKVSEIVRLLRRHFSAIPDFRHVAGIKIRISCNLSFESEPFDRVWGSEINGSDGTGPPLPTMYAIVLKFSSSAPYGSIPSQHIPFLLGETNTKEGKPPLARVFIELEPREPVPGLVDVNIEANTENGQIINGQLEGINVGIEDMFLSPAIPSDVSKEERDEYRLNLFNALWEACGSSSNIAHETFSLKGKKGISAISGTRSVKLVEVPFMYLIQRLEQYLTPFIVSVVGEPLVEIVKDGGIIKDVFFSDDRINDVVYNDKIGKGPLFLKYTAEREERGDDAYVSKKKNMGCFSILIFLPPRFHLLLQMEVSDVSTLVRIRTDHWPCLAYIDDYLEALFS